MTISRKEELSNIIFDMLNDNFDKLKVFGDLDDFTDIILKETEEWCNDCYQDHSGYDEY